MNTTKNAPGIMHPIVEARLLSKTLKDIDHYDYDATIAEKLIQETQERLDNIARHLRFISERHTYPKAKIKES